MTLEPPVIEAEGLEVAAALAEAAGVTEAAVEDVAAALAEEEGVAIPVAVEVAVLEATVDADDDEVAAALAEGDAEPGITCAMIEVIWGRETLAVLDTMTITEATAGIAKGVWSLFISSAEKTCSPGWTFVQV